MNDLRRHDYPQNECSLYVCVCRCNYGTFQKRDDVNYGDKIGIVYFRTHPVLLRVLSTECEYSQSILHFLAHFDDLHTSLLILSISYQKISRSLAFVFSRRRQTQSPKLIVSLGRTKEMPRLVKSVLPWVTGGARSRGRRNSRVVRPRTTRNTWQRQNPNMTTTRIATGIAIISAIVVKVLFFIVASSSLNQKAMPVMTQKPRQVTLSKKAEKKA